MDKNLESQVKAILDNNTGAPTYSGQIELPLSVIDEEDASSLLRPAQRESEEYKGLIESIKATGVLSPIAIRPALKDHTKFIIIDGVQRYNASKDAGLTTIKANLFPNVTDPTQIMTIQIQGNVHRVKTKPAQYGDQLKRVLAINPLMNMSELADLAKCSQGWVSTMLKLARGLNDDIKPLVDEGKLTVIQALKVAELPKDEQTEWAEKAQDKSIDNEEFMMDLMSRLAEIKREKQGLPKEEWTPKAKLRTLEELLDLLTQIEDATIDFEKIDTSSPEYRAGCINQLKYAISLDAESVDEQRAAQDAKEAERQRKKAEAAARKASEAAAAGKTPKNAAPVINIK